MKTTVCVVAAFILFMAVPVNRSHGQADQFNRRVDKSTIFYLFKNRGFEHLNSKLDEYLKAYEDRYSAEENLYTAYDVFAEANIELEKSIQEWIKKTPDHYAPYIARAEYYCAWARQVQGRKWIVERSGKQYKEVESYLALALSDIADALRKNIKLDMCYAMKIEAGMITGDEKLRDEALAEGLKNHPYAFMIRLQYLQALTPRWGGSYQEMQKFIDECRKFSDENPRLNELSASIPADKGRSYRFLGKNEDAIKMYDEALKISKMPVYYAERGDVYMQLQDFKSALADYEQALSLCPNDPDYLERKGKAASSIKNLSRLMKMNPGQKGFISNNTAEDDESLISERQKAIEHAKKGTTEMRAARFTSAIAEFSESIRLAPGEFVPYYSRGICYQQINNLDAALRDFQSAVERKPDEIGLQFRIARIYADRNMLNEAMNTLDIIISSDPRNGEAYFLRSRINERMGNNVNALDDMRQACDLEYQPACRYYKQVK